MKNKNIQILDLEFEYKLWKNWLGYSMIELEILKKRITVLRVEKVGWKLAPSKEALLVNQLSNLSSLEKHIKILEQEMAFYAKDYPIDNQHSHYVAHEKIRKDIEKLANLQAEIMTSIYPVLRYPLSQSDVS